MITCTEDKFWQVDAKKMIKGLGYCKINMDSSPYRYFCSGCIL